MSPTASIQTPRSESAEARPGAPIRSEVGEGRMTAEELVSLLVRLEVEARNRRMHALRAESAYEPNQRILVKPDSRVVFLGLLPVVGG